MAHTVKHKIENQFCVLMPRLFNNINKIHVQVLFVGLKEKLKLMAFGLQQLV